MDELIKDMAILEVKECDTVVVRVKYPIANEAAASIEKAVTEKMPEGVKVMVIDSNADIGIIRANL